MYLQQGWSETCVCGRTFTSTYGFTNHQRHCSKVKKRLACDLAKAKEAQRAKRRRISGVKQPTGSMAEEVAQREATGSRRTELVPDMAEEAAQPEATGSRITEDAQPEATGSHITEEVVQAGATGPSLHLTTTEIPLNVALLPDTQSRVDVPELSLAERRVRRANRQPPKRYRDILPEPPAALPPLALQVIPQHTQTQSNAPQPLSQQYSASAPPLRKILRSPSNAFGLFRQYYATHFPEHDPAEHVTPIDLNVSPDLSAAPSARSYAPYPNLSSFLIGEWFWDGEKKSQSSRQNLVKIIGHPDFCPEDVSRTNWKLIDAYLSGERCEGPDKNDGWEDDEDGDRGNWIKTPIKINVPFNERMRHPGPKEFDAGILHHRKLTSVIRERITRLSVHPHLHFEPYEFYWQPEGVTEAVRVHGELYTSEAFIEAHNELQRSPPELGCNLPRVVLGLMFASDGTQLTSFSNAKLWPVYLQIGNESKDRRSKPSCQTFEHVAYLEVLPDAFAAFAVDMIGKEPDTTFTGHCQREMYHAQWSILLDEEFLEAYQHGMALQCCDEIWRRFYPRIFTYSADYKEKIVIVGIRNLGLCPCPRCIIPLNRVPNMGMRRDLSQRVSLARTDDVQLRNRRDAAREAIYKHNHLIDGAAVKRLLLEHSLVPASNAFSEKLSPFGFNMFSMMVVDLLHEVEIGVWKAVFIHLLRLLDCVDEKLKHDLDCRFREVPPFGVDGVRKTKTNRSELKKMTAHDYEDMLQCAIPAFDALLPEPHNTLVLKLLFDLAHWHGLAKLRMHTDSTLELLEKATIDLGSQIREFQEKTCCLFETRELERERAARMRRREKQPAATAKKPAATRKTKPNQKVATAETKPNPPGYSARQPKQFNLETYKYHALGDYSFTIRRFGTTDSYSTQSSEREHRTSKGRFTRTSGRLIPQQLSRIEQRQRRIRTIRENLNEAPVQIDLEDIAADPGVRYNIGRSQKNVVHIPTFLQRNYGDPATKNFYVKLKEHLLPRLKTALQKEGDFRPELSTINASPLNQGQTDYDFVFFKNESIYQHKVIRFNFTTYDIRRGVDFVKPDGPRCNIMLLADRTDNPNSHPFLYARVLGAYHANVIYTGPGMRNYAARSFDFLWVRWYTVVDSTSGWKSSTLDTVRFPPMHEDTSFGFVDPCDVLRGCHIIPAFGKGKRKERNANVSRCAEDTKDYLLYFVGRFSDRDLVMRYHEGLGVGHFQLHQFGTSNIRQQRDGEVPDDPIPQQLHGSGDAQAMDIEDEQDEVDNPEMGLEDRENEGWEDNESDDSRDGDDDDNAINSDDYDE